MILKIFLSFFFIHFFTITFSQEIKTDFVCLYNLQYNRSNKTSDNEQFILLIDNASHESLFLSSTIYAMTQKSDKNTDYSAYESAYKENVLFKDGKFSVFEKIKTQKYYYTEGSRLKWEILESTKLIGTVKVQLAKTKAYGRIWYAWFSNEIPINYGPYKFNGLPGFIINLYDENQTFIFTLQEFKKKKLTYSLPNIKYYKKIDKSNLNTLRFKIKTADDGSMEFEKAEERKKWFDMVVRQELSDPLIDNEYPIKK